MTWRRAAAAVACTVGLSVASAACASPRNGLGTSASACFSSLPAARARGANAPLAGVRRLGPRALHRLAPDAPPLSGGQHACMFVFRLSSHGPYRVVIVARGTVVHDAVTPTPPGRLRHL